MTRPWKVKEFWKKIYIWPSRVQKNGKTSFKIRRYSSEKSGFFFLKWVFRGSYCSWILEELKEGKVDWICGKALNLLNFWSGYHVEIFREYHSRFNPECLHFLRKSISGFRNCGKSDIWKTKKAWNPNFFLKYAQYTQFNPGFPKFSRGKPS